MVVFSSARSRIYQVMGPVCRSNQWMTRSPLRAGPLCCTTAYLDQAGEFHADRGAGERGFVRPDRWLTAPSVAGRFGCGCHDVDGPPELFSARCWQRWSLRLTECRGERDRATS